MKRLLLKFFIVLSGLGLLVPQVLSAQCGWANAVSTGGRMVRADSGQLYVYGSRIAGYASNGDPLWAHNIRVETALPVADGLIIGGGFRNALQIDTLQLTETSGSALYVAKLNVEGEVQWAHSWASQDTTPVFQNKVLDLIQHNGSLYATGGFVDTLLLGTDTLAAPTDTGLAEQKTNTFLLKMNAIGQVDTALVWGKGHADYGKALAADAAGNLYLLGYYTDSIVLNTDTLVANGLQAGFPGEYPDYFLMRLSPTLSPQWAMTMGAAQTNVCPGDLPHDLLAHAGRLFVSGSFHPGAEIGSLLLQPIGVACAPVAGLACIDTAGQPLWARQISSFLSSGARAEGLDLRLSANDVLYWAGSTSDSAKTSPTSDTLTTPNGLRDGFIAQLDTAGNWQSIQLLGGEGVDVLSTAIPLAPDSILLSGVFSDTLSLGSRLLTAPPFSNSGFLAQTDTNLSLLSYVLPADVQLTCNGSYTPQLDTLPGASYLWSPDTGVSDIAQLNPVFSPTATTTYALQYSQSGCTATDSLTITVNPPDFGVGFGAGPTMLQIPNASIVFTNTTPNPTDYSFVWQFGDGDSSITFNASHTYTDTGLFSVTLIATETTSGCSDSLTKPDFVTVIAEEDTTPITGIEALEAAGLRVYPNPVITGGELTVKSETRVEALTLIGLDGKRYPLHTRQIPALAGGVYVLEIQRASGITRMRLVVQ